MFFQSAALTLLSTALALAAPTTNIAPAKNSSLGWAPCNLDLPASLKATIAAQKSTFYCATLKVPLDYRNERSGRTIDLQLIKVKGDKGPVKGTILTQPGGPGISGIEEVIKNGVKYRDIFGGNWDVVAFDPRGTGRTIPFACNPINSTATKLAKRETDFVIPQANLYKILNEKAWHDGGLYAKSCGSTSSLKDYASYMSTPFAARDMLRIVDALGEDGQLRLWGRSYGTVLGQTFAAMFPKRVGRMVLDSVVRFDDYYSGQWLTTNRDTEKALRNFFKECIGAGSTNCPLANFTGAATTVDSLHKELGAALQDLMDDDVVLPQDYKPVGQWWQPGITLYQAAKYNLLVLAYRPEQFGQMYILMEFLLDRQWRTVDINTIFTSTPPANATTPPEKPWNLGLPDSFNGILCSDTQYRASKPEELFSLLKAQSAQGSFMDVFAPQLWVCAQWPFAAVEQFKGPYTNITTRNPILMINSPNDPITPLSGTWEASANFIGSRVLVHNGHGHGSVNHRSKCTEEVIRRYFDGGEMPVNGKVCETDRSGFEEFLVKAEEAAKALNGTSEPTPWLLKRSLGWQDEVDLF